MEIKNQYNIQVFNIYQIVPPQQRSDLHYQPRQASNYKKRKSNNQPQPYKLQSQIYQPSIIRSMSLPPTYGQMPYASGKKDPNFSDIHSFNLLDRGKGIDQNEYYYITHAANDALQAREDPLSSGIIKRIKRTLRGEWMAVSCIKGLKGYDFTLSIVTGNDFLSFTIENFHFQICRLRD